ncbi:MAG: 30S ribosomal protein S20, partial [Planctomycetes bacterium]|nr:30S ribosomal protein S20 [Planctomycetota bacterium]
LRKLSDAVTAGDPQKLQDELKASLVRLDKSATKGIIHPKKAARKKSRLQILINKAANAG